MESTLFQPYHIGSILFKNRIIRSATHESLADENGLPTPELAKRYAHLAQGGVGAIISGYLFVQADGKCPYTGPLMMDSDECIEAYRPAIEAAHQTDTPVIAQLAHAGRQTRSKITGFRPVAPSAIRDKQFDEEMPHELDEGEIEGLINHFVAAVRRSKDAGFDGVQLHLAHGYLLSEFLSPHANCRTDRWGGNTENRFRVVAEIFRRVKTVLPDYPVLVKLNAYDGQKNGMRVDEAVRIAKLLEAAGCAAIEISCGTAEDYFMTSRTGGNPVDAIMQFSYKTESIPGFIRPLIKPMIRKSVAPIPPARLYNLDAAKEIKAAVQIPVMVVGGIRTLAEMTDIIDQHHADLVALSRPFILEPVLVNKLKEGRQTEARCISCNYCQIGLEKETLHCYFGKIKKSNKR